MWIDPVIAVIVAVLLAVPIVYLLLGRGEPEIRKTDARWMLWGVGALLLLVLVVLYFGRIRNPAEELASKATRVDLVSEMQLALASASEAEKSAVLSISEEGSRTFADQARAATAEVERQRGELERLLKAGGTPRERAALAQFAQAFTEFQRVDSELLDLAVTNTNLKAYNLAFGPALDALDEMTGALSRLVATRADSPDARQVALLALGSQISALRIQTLLPLHIAEEQDSKMDELEARMAREEAEVRKDLDALAALPMPEGDADRATAVSSFVRFSEIKTQILALSRENSDVRSLAISMNQKRQVMLSCQDALNVLRQAILEEPIAGVTYGRPARPR